MSIDNTRTTTSLQIPLLTRDERQRRVIIPLELDGTGDLVRDPRLETVERQRLVVGVELVGEELAPRRQVAKVFHAKDADAAHERSRALARQAPLDEHRHPRLAVGRPCIQPQEP